MSFFGSLFGQSKSAQELKLEWLPTSQWGNHIATSLDHIVMESGTDPLMSLSVIVRKEDNRVWCTSTPHFDPTSTLVSCAFRELPDFQQCVSLMQTGLKISSELMLKVAIDGLTSSMVGALHNRIEQLGVPQR